MQITLILLAALAGILSLIVGLPIARGDLERWPRLAWVSRHRFLIATSTILLSIVCAVLAAIDVSRRTDIEITVGPRGQIAPITSAAAARQEIEQLSRRQADEALRLFRSGDSLLATHDFVAAASAYRESAAKVPTKAALTNLALCDRYAGDLVGSAEAARRAIAVPQLVSSDDRLHANATLQLGVALSELGKRDEARIYLSDAFQRFKLADDHTGLAMAEYAMGLFEFRCGNTNKALELLSSASARFRGLQNALGQASAMNALGVTRLEAGATDDGVESLTIAVTLYREAGFRYGEAGALLNIGTARQDKCELDAALSAYDQCATTAKEIRNNTLAALATANAADVLLERGDIQSAQRRAIEAIDLSRRVTAPETEGWAHLTRAGALRHSGRVAEASAEVALARAKLAELSAVGTLRVTIEEAKIAIYAKRFSDATVLLKKAHAVANSSKYYLYLPEVLELTADIWERQGDRNRASRELEHAREVVSRHSIRTCAARRIESRVARN